MTTVMTRGCVTVGEDECFGSIGVTTHTNIVGMHVLHLDGAHISLYFLVRLYKHSSQHLVLRPRLAGSCSRGV